MGRTKPLRQSLPSLWRILKHFWPYMRPHRPMIAASLVALISTVGLRALEPWPLKFIFDCILGG